MMRPKASLCFSAGLFCGWLLLLLVGCGPPQEDCKFGADCPESFPLCIEGLCKRRPPVVGDGSVPDRIAPPTDCQDGQKRVCYPGKVAEAGVGACVQGEQVCVEGEWSACKGAVLPTEEICEGEIDEDCDGLTNEGCDCPSGETRLCYRGPKGTHENLPCRGGEQACGKDEKWSDVCVGQALPGKESCNGIDDDCNGQIDDDCTCQPGETKSCYVGPEKTVGEGLCQRGEMTCGVGASWGACIGAVGPQSPEACDGKDDDCDGVVDNGCECSPGITRPCYTGPRETLGEGPCRRGVETCSQRGRWGGCQEEVTPQSEACNGEDDDCNGKIDDALPSPPLCDLQVGVCGGARKRCGAEGWGRCTVAQYTAHSAAFQENETACDGKDNDCDGQIDELTTRSCFEAQTGCVKTATGYTCKGRCSGGTQRCSSGKWSTCLGFVGPVREICDNGADDDCDGQVDNGCQCQPNQRQRCYSGPKDSVGKGPCKEGLQTCKADGRWGTCVGEVAPTTEDCDAKDNDCNGKIDDALNAPVCPQTKGVCGAARKRCAGTGGWQTCTSADYRKGGAYEATETSCDSKDNDCDGLVDENLVRACFGATRGCTKNANGTYTCQGGCQTGTQKCRSGVWESCRGDIPPSPEVCDGKDNDCNGQIDEGNPEGGRACAISGQQGECAKGETLCANSKISCKQVHTPKPEKPDNCANGKDDDCDGLIDNKCGDCSNGETRACFTQGNGCTSSGGAFTCKGRCKAGSQRCVAEKWGPCNGQIAPATESCNWADDDCDGHIDNNTACLYSTWTPASAPAQVAHVAFLTPQRGVAVGTDGKAWRTADGGKTFTSVTSGTTSALHHVAALPNGLVLAVGASGTILRSTNDGQSYRKITSGTTLALHGVAIGSNRFAVAVGAGGTVLTSSDGGVTWQAQVAGTNQDLFAAAYKPGDSQSMLVAGAAGTLLVTGDHGVQWTAVTSQTSQTLRGLAWQGATAVAVGDAGTVLRTTNGTNWQDSSPKDKLSLRHVVSPGRETFVAAAGTRLFVSVDNGASWHSRDLFAAVGTAKGIALRTPTSLLAYSSGKGSLAEGPARYQGHQPALTFRSVAYNNASKRAFAMAVGDNGALYRSVDSGDTWRPVYVPTDAHLYGVGFYNSSPGLAVGEGGTILRSTNDGATWSLVNHGQTTERLTSVAAYASYAIAVGLKGTALYSSSSGLSWSKATATSPPGASSGLHSVTFKNSTALAVGDDGWLLRSTDRGRRWTRITANVPTGHLRGVYLYSSSSSGAAVVVGDGGAVAYSRNAGGTWTSATSGTTQDLLGVAVDFGNAVAVGRGGTIIRSPNYGQTWTTRAGIPGIALLGAFRSYSTSFFLAAGAQGLLLKSSDRGLKWGLTAFPGTTLQASLSLSSTTLLALGGGGFIASSTNAGQLWSLVPAPHPTTYRAAAVDANGTVVIAGDAGGLARSVNGGKAFSKVSAVNSQALFGVAVPSTTSKDVFVAVGGGGTILRSTDGGRVFAAVSSGTTSALRGIHCHTNVCVAVGDGGILLRATNGGASFGALSSPTTKALQAVRFGSAQRGVAVGAGGVALYTEDAGQTWKLASTPGQHQLFHVASLTPLRYLATDALGRLLASADSGKTWHVHAPAMGRTLFGLHLTGTSAFAVGAEGLRVLYTSP